MGKQHASLCGMNPFRGLSGNFAQIAQGKSTRGKNPTRGVFAWRCMRSAPRLAVAWREARDRTGGVVF